jgi:hypothetical protein
MEKEEKKSSAKGARKNSPYEELCGEPLTAAEEAEMNYNLINFVEMLIAMDRQHEAWLKEQKDQPKETV